MAQTIWEADKMLDVYIYDYLVKRNLQASAKAFQTEGKVSSDPVAIDAPGGFLFEWWSVFWDIFIARTNEKHSDVAASYIETQQMKAREQQQQQQQQQLQLLRQQQQVPRRDATHLPINGAANGIGADNMQRQQTTANALATKIYEECLKHPQKRDGLDDASMKRYGDGSNQLVDPSQNPLLKTTATTGQPSGQILHNGTNNMNNALQQVQVRNQSLPVMGQDNKSEITGVLNQRPPATDPSLFGMTNVGHSKPSLLSPGINQAANSLKGWPLTGLDQLRPNLVQSKSFIQSPQQYHQIQMLSSHQQQILMQAQQAQGNMSSTSSPLLNDMESRRFKMLLRSGIANKDGQPTGMGDVMQGVGSPLQAASPVARSNEELLMKVKLAQMQHQQQQQQLQQLSGGQGQSAQHTQSSQQAPSAAPQQQLIGVGNAVDGTLANNFRASDQTVSKGQNGRKRKQPPASSSGPANSTGTGNTAGPNSAPSTPSTHTPGDMISMANALQQNGGSSKPLMMYGSDGTGPLGGSSNQLAEIDRFADDGSLDDNVESFLSHEEADPREPLFSCSKRSPTGHNMDVSKGFSFTEVGRLQASNSKVVSCHFSSDGKLLASAGHDKKAVLWNMDTLKLKSTLEEHNMLITDVRFSPSSTRLATSSFDKTVRVWEVDSPSYSLRNFSGHHGTVMSLDFHPKNEDILCSCDEENQIHFWSVSQGICTGTFQGGISQVRFQPRTGKYLAAATDNIVAIYDVETETCVHSLQRHTKPVHSLCWDANGDYVASVSEDSVRVWSLKSGSDGECLHELNCNGNKFHSCVFHPTYSQILVIGCYQSLELWCMQEKTSMTIPAHDGLIAALAQSPVTGMVASASHDKIVKLWK